MLAKNSIHERALATAAAVDEKRGPYFAEVVPGKTPYWYLIAVMPGHEHRATAELSNRGFGVFRPKFAKDAVLEIPVYGRNGKIQRTDKVKLGGKLIFPGRLFVFVWDIEAHWRRVRDNPSVQRIMVDGKEKPVKISDDYIGTIQAMEFKLSPTRRQKRKRYKAAEDGQVITIRARSFWNVDEAERTAALDASLEAR